MFDIGLPSHKSLFEIQADRLSALKCHIAEKFKGKNPVKIPWYIMTSEPTHELTVNFFKKNQYFGLDEGDIFFFQQGSMPSFDLSGRILLEDRDKVFTPTSRFCLT